jgi:hypothetical protein
VEVPERVVVEAYRRGMIERTRRQKGKKEEIGEDEKIKEKRRYHGHLFLSIIRNCFTKYFTKTGQKSSTSGAIHKPKKKNYSTNKVV